MNAFWRFLRDKRNQQVLGCREALKERTRARVPLDWAMMQSNLGVALSRLGEREGGTGKLEEAVATQREALKERTRERVKRRPLRLPTPPQQ